MKEIKYIKPLLAILVLTFRPTLLIAQIMNISNGLQVIANGNITLVADQSGIKNDGVFIPGNSTVYFSGNANTVINGSQPLNFYNLILQGAGSKINNGSATVTGILGVEGTTTLDADGILNDRSFTLKSSDTATASVDKLVNGNITGNITVERFINTGTATGQHAKSWQFLSTPTTGQTFFQSWQENGTVPIGYGTILTGTGTGFDITTALPSAKYFDESTGNWTGITNTNNPLQNKLGYMLFVRGDRTVTSSSTAPNNTTLRSKGILFTPANPPAPVPVTANKFQSVGNPYASRIEFDKVYQASNGINNVFYVWDPKLNGTYNLGGYQTISAITGYLPTAGGATTSYAAGVPNPYIESGQAIFVHGGPVSGFVNFNENCKAAGNRLVTKTVTSINNNSQPPQLLQCSLFSNAGMIADGNILVFGNGLGNELNEYDAGKMTNTGENFSIVRDGRLLAVEAREPISINDTIFYAIQNLRQQPYQLRFAPLNISTNLLAYLVDRFTNSSTMISLSDSSAIDFTITADSISFATDRFILVFHEPLIVPLYIVKLVAFRDDHGVNQITWDAENETGIHDYTVERSVDGIHFNPIGHISPLSNNGNNISYRYADENASGLINFYRIKATDISGNSRYSNIVKVLSSFNNQDIAIYPNPVTGNKINIHFTNQTQGNYILKLTNKLGQVIYMHTIHIGDGNSVYSVSAKGIINAGTYQLSITAEGGYASIKQVLLK